MISNPYPHFPDPVPMTTDFPATIQHTIATVRVVHGNDTADQGHGDDHGVCLTENHVEKNDITKDCLQILTSKRVKREGAPRYKIDVRSDRSHPHIDVDFNDGHKIIFKTEHLKPYDVVSRLDVFCKAKDTSLGEADIALTKMAGKQKRKK
ncbi:hypothetical protein MAR_030889 [Mya arenaria]|uniref:Uncharacterized protein n=1 Tax=Mya arenaria TaxID=6604 RepID=A0ABY7F297_MYAAR|nr:hypothetical protein MAR_030889 [Mya arenaria]